MPKVKLVTAAKDYPQFGIVKGQQHFHWTLMTGPRSSQQFRQVTPPRPSQLTSSEFLGRTGDLQIDFDDMVMDDSLADSLREMADTFREIGAEQQEKFDNMPEGLQQGSTGEMLENRATDCDYFANELESEADTLEHTLDEINSKDWTDLDQFASHDPEEDGEPDESEIEDAREAERSTARDEAHSSLSFPSF